MAAKSNALIIPFAAVDLGNAVTLDPLHSRSCRGLHLSHAGELDESGEVQADLERQAGFCAHGRQVQCPHHSLCSSWRR